jgi:YhcG PDDEXK nuclease domain
LKGPYIFDFLTLTEPFQERELEVGLILCQTANDITAEYTLRGFEKPIGVSSYEFARALPKELASSLPSIEEIEREFESHTPTTKD